MAFKPEDLPNGVPPDANYPQGRIQDETTPGVSDDGTPIEQQIANDIQGKLQAAIANENITPSSSPDTALVSDHQDAASRLAVRGGDLVDVAGAALCILGKINRPLNGAGAITVLLPTTGLYAGAVVPFDEDPPERYSVNSVTFDAGSAVIGSGASPVQTVEVTSNNILGGFRRNRANTRWVPYKTVLTGTEI